jgi:hypothetical protein
MRIILGYGECKGHSLPETPDALLRTLSQRFPLQFDKYDPSDGYTLIKVVAIYEEVRRRDVGGERNKRVPTLKELASDVVTKGYHQLSKTHHPDRKGDPEAQRRLNEARDRLIVACGDIVEEDEDAIIIEGPEENGPEVTDEDIPF